jgi:hypothetical protein
VEDVERLGDPHGQWARSQFGASSKVYRGLKSRKPAASCLQPDPSPGDFSLFGNIKGKLYDYNYENREEFLNAITEIFTGVDQEVLPVVFESWVNQLKWVIKHKEQYYTE